MSEMDERSRRWTLALGVDPEAESGAGLSDSDRRMSEALTALAMDRPPSMGACSGTSS